MLSLAEIRTAKKRIAGYIIRTPLIYSPTLSAMTGANVYLKLETLQKAGSFKVRGAINKILSQIASIPALGVVTASAGNHAQGVAVAAHLCGMPATIVMPEWSSISKQEAARGYGAEVILKGSTLEESLFMAQSLAAEGRLFIHPYDDEEVIAGQGTIGLEILADLPLTDIIIVPVGGGGLIAGIATAVKAVHPEITVIGAQAATFPSIKQSSQKKKLPQTIEGQTIADGIRVTEIGTHALPVIRELVARIVFASEIEIADAMLLLLERKKIIAEGAGAVPLAVLLNGSIPVEKGKNIVLVISGGNVDSFQLFRIIRQVHMRQKRIVRFSVLIDDRPGSLAKLLTLVAHERGNILHIHHAQGESDIPVQMVRVELEIETRGREHSEAIRNAISAAHYRIDDR